MSKGLNSKDAPLHFAYVILVVWVVNFVADVVSTSYQPRPEIQGLMMAAVTFMFGKEVFKKPSNDKEDQDDAAK